MILKMKKMNCVKRHLFSLCLCFACCMYVGAQAPKLVMGRVLDKERTEKTGKPVPFDITQVDVKVYFFNTEAEGRDVEKALNSENVNTIISAMYEVPDATGSYQITLPETGSIVIKVDMAPAVFEAVNRRREIITKIDGGHVLGTVNVIARRTEVISDPVEVEQYGDMLTVGQGKVPVPPKIGKSNARMIVRPYVINNSKNKAFVMNRIPHVYDGNQYALTQERRMAYDMTHDSLKTYIRQEEPLTDQKYDYIFSDTIKLPNNVEYFQLMAEMQIEDYTGPYYRRVLEISRRSPRRPMRFLEYSLDEYELDPKKYEERPKAELRTGVEDVSLSFLLGKAELNPADSTNEEKLNALRGKLLEVVNGESSSLKELHLYIVSSPDGSYASNMALSKRRLEYARSLIYKVIPPEKLRYLYSYTPNDTRVGTWNEVADLLAADSLTAEADAVRAIVKKYPQSQDVQFRHVAALPYYKTLIRDRLPKLRSMKCEYKAEIFRALTKEEILRRYNEDPDYRSGKKQFALYEYWHLFNMVKDPKELEHLYRRAYDYSKELTNGKPWILAANNLAVSYLKRDTVCVEILKPLVDFSVKRCNVQRTFDGRVVGVDNVEEVVANQLAMYLKLGNFEEASRLAQLLPDTEKNKRIKAFTTCLGGRYKVRSGLKDEEIARRLEHFELVRSSSPRNNVIMCLAMNTHAWNQKAEQALEDLPADDALTYYLRAVLLCRKGDFYSYDAEQALKTCFQKDKKYIAIAEWDGDITEDCFKYAKEAYEDELLVTASVNGI